MNWFSPSRIGDQALGSDADSLSGVDADRETLGRVVGLVGAAHQRQPQCVVGEEQPLERRDATDAIVVGGAHHVAGAKDVALEREARAQVPRRGLALGRLRAGADATAFGIDQAGAGLVERRVGKSLDQRLGGREEIAVQQVVVPDQGHVWLLGTVEHPRPAAGDRQGGIRSRHVEPRVLDRVQPFECAIAALVVENVQARVPGRTGRGCSPRFP